METDSRCPSMGIRKWLSDPVIFLLLSNRIDIVTNNMKRVISLQVIRF